MINVIIALARSQRASAAGASRFLGGRKKFFFKKGPTLISKSIFFTKFLGRWKKFSLGKRKQVD